MKKPDEKTLIVPLSFILFLLVSLSFGWVTFLLTVLAGVELGTIQLMVEEDSDRAVFLGALTYLARLLLALLFPAAYWLESILLFYLFPHPLFKAGKILHVRWPTWTRKKLFTVMLWSGGVLAGILVLSFFESGCLVVFAMGAILSLLLLIDSHQKWKDWEWREGFRRAADKFPLSNFEM